MWTRKCSSKSQVSMLQGKAAEPQPPRFEKTTVCHLVRLGGLLAQAPPHLVAGSWDLAMGKVLLAPYQSHCERCSKRSSLRHSGPTRETQQVHIALDGSRAAALGAGQWATHQEEHGAGFIEAGSRPTADSWSPVQGAVDWLQGPQLVVRSLPMACPLNKGFPRLQLRNPRRLPMRTRCRSLVMWAASMQT